MLEADIELAQEALRATADEIEESQRQEPDDDPDLDRGVIITLMSVQMKKSTQCLAHLMGSGLSGLHL